MNNLDFEHSFSNNEDAFINSAYLSELWAVQDLINVKKKFTACWSDSREIQLNDEITHSRILLDKLQETSKILITNTKFSMQERIYKKYINLSSSSSYFEHCAVHKMTESRATWIYKTFMKLNPDSRYNACLMRILADEKNHINIDSSADENLTSYAINGIDRMIFKNILPKKYGSKIFENNSFWNWYYSNQN